jgi:uncharacterized protein (TIGR00251 family)
MKIKVHIIPHAQKNEIVGRSSVDEFRIKIQSPPVDGAANKELIKFLAGVTGVSKSKVSIMSGLKSRNKIVEISGDEKAIRQRMEGSI